MSFLTNSKKNKTHQTLKITITGFFVVVISFFIFLFIQFSQGPVLEKEITVTIPDGYSIIQTGQLLEDNNIIHSRHLFRLITQYKNLVPKSGPYYFSEPADLFNIIDRISSSEYGDVYTTITFPEGSTNEQYVHILKNSEFDFKEDILRTLIDGKEGYLFPDTYSFLPDITEAEAISNLEKTFSQKFKKALINKVVQKTDDEIVVMASIIEKEAANDLHQKQIIAGILWKRIEEGIPLQVDAPFLYEREKGSAQLSLSDLRTNSPYNTYTNRGLTPTAIGNPGYDALYAAAHPIDSPYYFYLHASDGLIYYGKNHDEHLKNKRMYLR